MLVLYRDVTVNNSVVNQHHPNLDRLHLILVHVYYVAIDIGMWCVLIVKEPRELQPEA